MSRRRHGDRDADEAGGGGRDRFEDRAPTITPTKSAKNRHASGVRPSGTGNTAMTKAINGAAAAAIHFFFISPSRMAAEKAARRGRAKQAEGSIPAEGNAVPRDAFLPTPRTSTGGFFAVTRSLLHRPSPRAGTARSEKAGRAPGGPPVPVVAGRSSAARRPILTDYVARTDAMQTIDIRPRVAGFLKKVSFVGGGLVREGQLLFVIQPEEYQAALQTARAQQQKAEADLVQQQDRVAVDRAAACLRSSAPNSRKRSATSNATARWRPRKPFRRPTSIRRSRASKSPRRACKPRRRPFATRSSRSESASAKRRRPSTRPKPPSSTPQLNLSATPLSARRSRGSPAL